MRSLRLTEKIASGRYAPLPSASRLRWDGLTRGRNGLISQRRLRRTSPIFGRPYSCPRWALFGVEFESARPRRKLGQETGADSAAANARRKGQEGFKVVAQSRSRAT